MKKILKCPWTISKLNIYAILLAMIGACLPGPASAKDPAKDVIDRGEIKWIAAMYVGPKGVVGLRWVPVKGATGYRILRRVEGEEGFTEIATSSATQYFDREVVATGKWGEVGYRIQAIGSGGTIGESEEKKVSVIPHEKLEKVDPPRWENAGAMLNRGWDQDACKVVLKWKISVPQQDPRLIGFRLYLRETRKDEKELRTTLNSDENLYAEFIGVKKHHRSKKKVHHYSISALYNNNYEFVESEMSEERTVACWYWRLQGIKDQELVDIVNHALNSNEVYLQKAALIAMEAEKPEAMSIDEISQGVLSNDRKYRLVSLIALEQMNWAEADILLKKIIEGEDTELSEAAKGIMEKRLE